jgi:NitT/TauT family transport system substrate-binding protein
VLVVPAVHRVARLVVVVVVALAGAACSSGASSTSGAATPGSPPAPVTLRLGYFPNITHAAALVGVNKGLFQKALGGDTLDASKTFNAGPAAVEALLSGAIDATFVGPSPSINAFTKSNGAVRIVSGAASGGAALVTKPSIASVDQLKGRTVATPQLGNTQDVALRAFLTSKGFKVDTQGGGDVSIKPQDNSQTVDTFKAGTIDGAWVPEPYLTQLVQAGGHVLVDEKDLWPGGKWVTTNLLVSKSFLDKHPSTVEHLLAGLVDSVDFIASDPAGAEAAVDDQIGRITGKKLAPAVLAAAFTSSNLTFTVDPIASSLRKQASDAEAAGVLTNAKTDGIYDLRLLDKVLEARHRAAVPS